MSNQQLSQYAPRLEAMARDYGLDYYPVDFELVPNTFMMEVAVYGLPVRMPHWSFGVRYIYQYVQHRMGHSRIFEVVFPGDPNRAYLVTDNKLAENTLVTAHVLGHADFSRNNALFGRMQSQVGFRIVEQAAERAHRIQQAIEEHGQRHVEAVLDAALALEQNVDVDRDLIRSDYPLYEAASDRETPTRGFRGRYAHLPGEEREADGEHGLRRAPIPPQPEFDLLWFIARYGPELEDWERDIFLAVREESFYFYPLFACQIMNEGWASYWHARLLREADFLPQQLYLDAIKAHSDVVRPYAGSESVSLSINPYHVGFCIWEKIIEDRGLDAAFRIRAEEDDYGFIRNYLDEGLARQLQLFAYTHRRPRAGEDRYVVEDRDIHRLRELILAPKFNYGAPRVYVQHVAVDGSLTLRHEARIDGRGLDLPRARKVLEYIQRVWRRPVRLHTVDGSGEEEVLEVSD
ncbi:MAG TPA: SpoVR family protein [Gammaproteobacteria bacterium]|nr:SpoVR family protein [Gammaproteobacteria bacterium]